jgi:hypothetical protein
MNPNDQQSCAALDGVNADPKIEQVRVNKAVFVVVVGQLSSSRITSTKSSSTAMRCLIEVIQF